MTDINSDRIEYNWDEFNLSPNTKAFIKRVYSSGLQKYEKRLISLGFQGGQRGLDAGCGLGQWSVSLSSICREIYGVDVSMERISACNTIAAKRKIQNATFLQCSLENLPFPNAHFDRLICYSVLYLTDYRKSIFEFSRIMRPGGLIYISTNGIGRYIYDIVKRPNPAQDFDPRIYGIKSIFNTLTRKRTGLSPLNGGTAMSPNTTKKILIENGFDIIEIGPEGTLLGKCEPFLPSKHYGFTSAFDILARKK